MKAVITAGPTLEPIDPVRYLSNRSSGKQGFAIAEALRDQGFDVALISGPVALNDPEGLTTIRVETACEMLDAVNRALPAEVFISVAAVADWRPAQTADKKLKLDKSAMASLPLVENPDILKTISQYNADRRPDLVVGFAAETHNMVSHAREKRLRKGCDWIVANDVSGDVMGGGENEALLITHTQEEPFARMTKTELAHKLADRIKAHLQCRQ